MNREQKLSLVRDILKIVGMGLVSNGLVSAGGWDIWTTIIVEIVGCGLVVVPMILSQIAHTKASAVAVVEEHAKEDPAIKKAVVEIVDAMPEVAKVITKATPAGEALALAVPSSTVVAASDPRAKSGL